MYTFSSLRQSETAVANLRKTQKEDAEIALRLKRQTAVEVNIEATQLTLAGDDGLYISAVVTLQNKGNKPALMLYKDVDSAYEPMTNDNQRPPFAVALVEFDEKGSPAFASEPVFSSSTKSQILNIPAKEKTKDVVTWQLIRVGPEYRIPFVVRVDDTGLYLASYRVRVGQRNDDQKIYKEATGKEMKSATLSASTYVEVKPPDPAIEQRQNQPD